MPRPVTLFTGQFADLPFGTVAQMAADWGHDGLEIACWGDHFEVDKAVSDPPHRRSTRPSDPVGESTCTHQAT